MFGIGMPELVIILALALVVVGPSKLPEIARAIGKGFAELKHAMNDLQRNIESETRTTEEKETMEKANNAEDLKSDGQTEVVEGKIAQGQNPA
jgi:Tat protein translocase TatB subunit